MKSVDNAALYQAGPDNARFNIVHVWGTPYEQGFAQGLLMKDDIAKFMAGTMNYLLHEGLGAFPGDILSPEAKSVLVTKGVAAALDFTIEATAPFTPQSYVDELKGISDGSGVSHELVYRLNMLPELTKASCSFFGAWGDATPGNTFQLRSLDYVTDAASFTDYPQVTVYHPTDMIAHASVAWPGVAGILTGMSEANLGISEIGVSFADDSFGQGTDNTPPEKVRGQPWMSVLKDVASSATSLPQALSIIEAAERTCNLIIGVGDGANALVNGVEYSGRVAVPYNDTTLLPANDTWHPQIEGVVYNGMDWDCPTYTSALGAQLAKYRGRIDAEVTIGNILPTVQTGNLHAAVYDLTESLLHLSFMRRTDAVDSSEPLFAYERQFTRLHMQDVFGLTQEQAKSDSEK